jgi:membrane protein
MVAIIDALNRAYDVSEWRPWWKRRFVAIVLTLALALFTIVALALLLIGPSLASRAVEWLGFGASVGVVWALIHWPAMLFCLVLGVDLVYHFAPNRAAAWVWITPGSLLATALGIGSSFGFKAYVVSVADYTATYGAIGGAIVTLRWFYLSGLAILIGAELNGVIGAASRTRGA